MKFVAVMAVSVLGLALVAALDLVPAEVVCPQEQPDDSFVVQFPSPTSCTVFYKCNRGVPHLNKCPEGLHYSPRLQACDFPQRAHCQLKDGA